MALQKALDKYTTHKLPKDCGANLELEIRFNLSREQFATIYENCSAKGAQRDLECTMVITSESGADSTHLMRQATFVKGISSPSIYKYKKSLFGGNVSGFLPYKIAVSEEGTPDAFTGSNAFMRFKARVSMMFTEKWRADFTAVYEGSSSKIGNSAKLIRERIFPVDLTVENFLEKMTPAVANKFELELEYVGAAQPQLADFEVVKLVFEILDPGFVSSMGMKDELLLIAKNISDRQPATLSQKGIACQAVALSKSSYYVDVFPPVGCRLTIKSDGQRVLVTVHDGKCRVLYGRHMIECPLLDGKSEVSSGLWIADGEEVLVKGAPVIQLFDVICADNQSIAAQSFGQRIAKLTEAASHINSYFPCVAKDYKLLTAGFAKEIESEWKLHRNFPVDGLIFVQDGKDYKSTRHYKWKPEEKNTTDFLAVKCPDFMMNKPPFIRQVGKTLYLLFCGIRDDLRRALGIGFIEAYRTLIKGLPAGNGSYYPIQFSPCENPQAFLYYHDDSKDKNLHGKVIELLRVDNTVLGWKFERIRSDRETGNDFVVAERNYFNVLDPFTLADLGVKSAGYFAQTSPEMRKAPNRLNRYALEMVLSVYFKGIKKLIDLGCGRGADLFRIIKLGVKAALFVDADAQALAELVRRRIESPLQKHHGRESRGGFRGGNAALTDEELTSQILSADMGKVVAKDTDNLTTYVMEADLTRGLELVDMMRRFSFYKGDVDGCMCNMALHYLCGERAHIEGVIKLVSTMLTSGGHFAFVVMDGAKVFDLLAGLDKGQSWERHEHGVPKYVIRKDYSGRSLQKTGQQISVLLPFVEHVELRAEPLCNVDYVKELAAAHGLKCVTDTMVSEYIVPFQKEFVDLAVRLTDDDKFYLGLHRVVCLVRT